MKQNKNKKKWTAAAAALAIIAALAGTFAWFTSDDQTKNHFETQRAGNDTEIVETFDPPKDWKPGQDVNKDVAVQNTGKYNALIRVSLAETINRLRSGDTALVFGDELATQIGKGFSLYEYNGDKPGENGWKEITITNPQVVKLNEGTADEVTYTLKVVSQRNASANQQTGNAFKYQAYWEGSDGKNYYAKTGPLKRDLNGTEENSATAEADDTVTVEQEKGAQFKLYDSERKEGSIDWRGADLTDPADNYKPTFTVNADGTAKIVSALPDGKQIELNFVNLSATPTEGKWTYNPKDGYFYYIGVVASGDQTPLLLDSVNLNSNAGNEYGDMKYDLTVNAEGIQAYEAAVVSDQWLTTGDESDDIIAALKALDLDDPNA